MDNNLTIGDYYYMWFDTGAMGVKQIYAKLLKLNRITVTVHLEHGNGPQRMTKDYFSANFHHVGQEWHPTIES